MYIHIFMYYIFSLQWIKLPVSREVTQTVEAMMPSPAGSFDSLKTEVQQQAGKPVPALPGPRHCILMEPITRLMCNIWGAGDGYGSFFEEIFIHHCSDSGSEVALPGFLTSHRLYNSFIFAQCGQGAFPTFYPWPWCSLCTCKWALSSTFHCTDSTSHPWSPSCSGSLVPSTPQPGLPRSLPKAQPPAPACPQIPGPTQAFSTTSSSNSSETTAEKVRLSRVLQCQTVEGKGYYVSASISKGLMPVHTLVWCLFPCIIPPMANTRCLFTNWVIFPISPTKPKQIYTTAARRSPDNMLSVCFPWQEAFPKRTKIPTRFSDTKLQFWVTAFPARFCWNAAVLHLKACFNIKSQIWLNLNQRKGLGRHRNNNTSI